MTVPTEKMVAAFNDADFTGCANADWSDEHVRIGLAAALKHLVIVDEGDRRLALSYEPHAHTRPGLWDRDGSRCVECAARDRLRRALP